MKDNQFLNRITEVMKEEIQRDDHWMYLSFADNEFKGAVIIKARGITDALMKCNLLQINPGGEVLGIDFPSEVLLPEEKYLNRLLTKVEVEEIWSDAKSIKEFEEEENEASSPN